MSEETRRIASGPTTPTSPRTLKAWPPRSPVRVCVVGAGCSGLCAIKALLEAGHEPFGVELGSGVGGQWVKDNDSGTSAVYSSLCINTSRKQMQFSDFPMSEEVGDFARHEQVADYFRQYAAHFALDRWVHFRTEVLACRPLPEGGYAVELKSLGDGRVWIEHFHALIVATGHHSLPALPEPAIPGRFQGDIVHSHAYRDPDTPVSLRGRRVVVVGMGNSAMDIACELAQARGGTEVTLAARRGAWVLPRYLFGRPIDQGHLVPHWLPKRLRRRIITLAYRLLVGRMSRYGLPDPDHLIGEAHPTLSSDLLQLTQSGTIRVRGAVTGFDGSLVHFSSGEAWAADALIFCTGYHVSFPFLATQHVHVTGNQLPLFGRVFHPEHKHLFFVGLVQPLGALMPIAELQSRWIAEHLSGDYNLPAQEELLHQLAQEEHETLTRYVPSPRHTMQVDPRTYQHDVARERVMGKRRARLGKGQPFANETNLSARLS